jgi:NAD(P)-dependent dehydrogenase (short-subunit alcohol dehydrogenase family)
VVWVTDNAHAGRLTPEGVNWGDLEMKDRMGMKANLMKYGQSKAMNVMFAYGMAHQHGKHGLAIVSVHTGALSTNLQMDLPFVLEIMFRGFRPPPWECVIKNYLLVLRRTYISKC